jgi:hypothetical protein
MTVMHRTAYSPSPASGRGAGERAAFARDHYIFDMQKPPLPAPLPLAGEGENRNSVLMEDLEWI